MKRSGWPTCQPPSAVRAAATRACTSRCGSLAFPRIDTRCQTGPVQPQPTAVGFREVRLRLPGPGSRHHARMARCAGFSKGFTAPERRRELPSRHVSLMISFSDPLLVVGDGGHQRVGSFVTGLQSRAATTERLGHQHGMHIQLAPLAGYALFGVPMAALTDTLVDLPAVLGTDAADLVERLASAHCWSERFAMLQAALVRRMANGPQPHQAVADAWRQLRQTNGSVRIEDVVERSGHSHRYLVSRFTEQIGMTPKAAARVLRFEHSLRLLQAGISIADVATATGHYDQSHLTREFRALAGCPPTELLGIAQVRRSDLSKTA